VNIFVGFPESLFTAPESLFIFPESVFTFVRNDS